MFADSAGAVWLQEPTFREARPRVAKCISRLVSSAIQLHVYERENVTHTLTWYTPESALDEKIWRGLQVQ